MGRCHIEPAMQAKQFKPIAPKPAAMRLARRPAAVKLPVEVAEALDTLPQPDRIIFLRRAISSAVLAELWPEGQPWPEWSKELGTTIPMSKESTES